ncbi:alkaline phosphatase [Streptomyces sp. SID3343]|nr:alkaline phosphatase [Streptomyces sp. SID3343]
MEDDVHPSLPPPPRRRRRTPFRHRVPRIHKSTAGRLSAVAATIAMLAAVLTFAEPASAADVLLSQGKPTTASSSESSSLGPAKAVDGSATTRWASEEGSAPAWISVDLGADVPISRVRLNWEAAYAKAYRIEVSTDASAWTKVFETTTGNGATDDLTSLSTHGRYVRMYATVRGTAYGYSLWELEVYGTGDGGGTSFTVVAAGDISDPGCTASDNCGAQRTAKRVEAINPDHVLTLGDNQYDTGSLADYRAYYDTTWGRFKAKTHPSPGNHEYDDSTPAAGYRSYFGNAATPNGTTWYSWNQGGWHFVALDSESSMSANSAQIQWLKADLASNSKACVAAYWHRPLYSSGPQADKVSQTAWQVLYDARADLILNGHDHLYERYAPQNPKAKADPNGVRELIVGTGGADSYDFENPQPNSEKRITSVFGVLKLTLTDNTYSGQLVRDDGKQLDSFGPVTCH